MNKSTLYMVSIAVAILGIILGLSVLSTSDQAGRAITQTVSSATAMPAEYHALKYGFLKPAEVDMQYDDYGDAIPAALGQNYTPHSGEMKSETLTIVLPLDGSVEYKMLMKQADGAVYSWTTDGGEAYYDFHAHAETDNPDFFTRYAAGESVSQSGSIVAAYTGQHGWFWFNISEGPMTITLDVAGFFDELVRISPEEN